MIESKGQNETPTNDLQEHLCCDFPAGVCVVDLENHHEAKELPQLLSGLLQIHWHRQFQPPPHIEQHLHKRAGRRFCRPCRRLTFKRRMLTPRNRVTSPTATTHLTVDMTDSSHGPDCTMVHPIIANRGRSSTVLPTSMYLHPAVARALFRDVTPRTGTAGGRTLFTVGWR